MNKTIKMAFVACGLGLLVCAPALAATQATIVETPFGKTPGGEVVNEYTLTNTQGMSVQILSYGGIIHAVKVPDRNGKLADVTLGFSSLDPYFTNSPYFGALIGRYGNRIAKGEFKLDGQAYHIYVNNGPNSLHGGKVGFNKVVWDAKPAITDGVATLGLHYSSPDGEEGYPGNLDVNVTYTLTNSNTIRIEYNATTDADTVVNLTNHAYWDLSGAGKGKILGTWMQIAANYFTPTDKTQIPTGEIRPVAGTAFDFRRATPLGARINRNDPQLKIGAGYDHNWVLSKPQGTFGFAAQATDPVSGRVLTVYTDQPGIQLYTGNFLEGTPPGKDGVVYHKNWGFALETQHYPDSPNHSNFPSTELKPGQPYHTVTEYRFSTVPATTRYVEKWRRYGGHWHVVSVAVAAKPVAVTLGAHAKYSSWHRPGHWVWVPYTSANPEPSWRHNHTGYWRWAAGR